MSARLRQAAERAEPKMPLKMTEVHLDAPCFGSVYCSDAKVQKLGVFLQNFTLFY
jgi:hypothetical protein